jgi:Methyltransferase domain
MMYTRSERQDHRAATVHHPLFSRLRPLLVRRSDERGMAERRARLLDGLHGRVIEVGAGSGATFLHYPRTAVEVVEGTTFDAAVSCNILCSVRDPVLATAELHRVLRPGGILRFNEHVVSEHPAVSRVQRAADATLWPLLSGGCHLGRDTLAELRRAGFVIEYCARTSGVRGVGPPKRYVFGSARRAYEPTAAPASP